MTVVKICGVRRVEDAVRAAELGARFIGCVLAPDSPRCATLDEVRAIRDAIDVEVVLVFRRPTVDEVVRACETTDVLRVQPHGGPNEFPIAGIHVHEVVSLPVDATELPELPEFPEARVQDPTILDVGRGGTGTSFDWSLLAPRAPDDVLIAGGITPDNVRELLVFSPFGIDVSSGVESAPGIKDHAALERLFTAVSR